MKKLLSLLLTLALLTGVLALPAAAADSYDGKTVILYTANLRGDLDAYAKIKVVRDAYYSKGAEIFLVDAGNYLQGTAAANADRGLTVYNLMDAAGYDVAGMALAEFGYTDATAGYVYHGNFTRYHTQAMLQNGTDAVEYNQNRDGSVKATLAAKEGAKFKALATNVAADKNAYAFDRFAVLDTKAGVKFGFYSLTDPAVARAVQDGFVSAVASPAAVKVAGADVTVCLTTAPGTYGATYGDVVIDASSGARMLGAYVVDNATHAVTHETVTLGDADPAIASLAAAATAAAPAALFRADVVLNGADSVNWNGESNLGDLTADALLWYAGKYVDGLEPDVPLVALQNGGNCDNFLYTGDVTGLDLLRALPFSPMGVGVLYVTGAQLLETLEAASQSANCPGFAQVAGLKYTVDFTQDYDGGAAYGKFFEADSVNRVTITEVGGKAFDPEATYGLVADNFVLNGNDTYYTLKNAKDAGAKYLNNGNGVKTRDVVALYVGEVLGGAVGETYAAPQGRITAVRSAFADVRSNDYCFDAVSWAVEQGVTKGKSDTEFVPSDPCTRAQIVTFLWRAAEKPEPAGDNLFTDVTPGDYYKAILWAAETGITKGTSETTFSPDDPCTRAQAVTFLFRFAKAEAPAGENPFEDVPADADYAPAVLWAVENGVTKGTGDTTFSPADPCSRGQIVTFLYRYLAA